MSDRKLQKLVLASLFAALTAVLTMVVRVPSPMGGYVNLGDCAVLLSAWVLGPVYGGAAAGLGSMLADLLGYPLYAPGTLVVKGLMALAAGWLFAKLRSGNRSPLPALAASGLLGEAIMVGGYFLYEAAPFPVGLGLAAAANVPFNLIQGAMGLACAGGVYLLLNRKNRLGQL